MTAVAVWERRPTAADLLEARLAHGWSPTATGTVRGDEVLGFAACAVPRQTPATVG